MKNRNSLVSILKTSVPIVVDLAAQIVMWTIEITFMGRIGAGVMMRCYPGAGARAVDAVTAVGSIVNIILWTFTVLLIFIFGASSVINRLVGAGRREDANPFLGQSLFTTAIVAIGIAALWGFLSPVIFRTLLGTTPAVTAVAADYLRTIAWFAPFIIMNLVAIGIVRGAGDTHLSMIVSLLVNGIHLVLAFVLIFGIGPLPALGPRGSAIAAGIGHTAGCVFTYSVILRGRSLLTFRWKDFRYARRKSIFHILRTGTPITLEQLAWMTGIIVVMGYTNRLGAVEASAHQIILTFQRLFSILYQAFAIGALTLVGRCYGANDHDHARHTTRTFFWLVGGVVLFIAAVIFLRARYFILLFTSDPEVVELGTRVLQIAAFVQIPKALSFIYSYSLRGVGENRYPMYLAFAGVLFFEIVLGFNLAFTAGLSLMGVWIAAGLDEIFKVSLAFRRFQRRIGELTT